MSRVLFQLTALAATAFVITILATVAIMLGDPAAPVNGWFNRHGTTLLLGEVAAVFLLGLAAMTADRRETLKRQLARTTCNADAQAASTSEESAG